MDLIMTAFILYILFTFTLSHAVKTKYRKIGTECLMQNDIYYTTYARSEIECSYYCNTNPYIPCARFIFKPEENQCLLHSDSPTGIPTTTSVTMTTEWDLYAVGHSECTLDGYDYIPHINWCVKLYYKVLTSWVAANEICQSDGGYLVSITTLEKWNFLSNYLNCVTVKFWAGLRGDSWINGEPFSNVFGVSMAWNNVPDSQFPKDPFYDCGVFAFTKIPAIVDVSCEMNQKSFFVCEIVLP